MNLPTKAHDNSVIRLDLYELENEYALIDLLPEALFAPVVTHSVGLPIPRTQSVLQLRHFLLEGRLPDSELAWPSVELQKGLFSALEKLGIVRYCYGNAELVDALLLDILTALDQKNGEYFRRYQTLVAQLTQQEKKKLEDLRAANNPKRKKKNGSGKATQKVVLSVDDISAIEIQAENICWSELIPLIQRGLANNWSERIELWVELESIFRDLQLVVQLGYDLSKGMLQSHGWLNIVKLRELLERLPQLQEVIRSLGRMQQIDGEPVVTTIMESIRRVKEEVKEVKSPLVPMEMKGIARGDSVSRMLPQEAALLGHPILKGLWHAKRAEHALLSYAVEGVELEKEINESEEFEEVTKQGREKRYEKGPILVCLDTSGSMSGSPEQIAKALVLETLRVAGKDKRGCYVYLFGSVNEVIELELSPNAEGMDKLISFLSMSFGGGTDVQGPVELALEHCKKEQWRQADLLIVSDGQFSYGDSLLQKVKRRKKSHGMRVHGVLIGNHSTMMERLCDPLHHFNQWQDLL